MWLRDSTFQRQTYLPLAAKSEPDSAIRRVIESAMARQRRFILDDPYGSAFYATHGNANDQGPNKMECPKSDTCPLCRCQKCAPKCGKYTYQKDYELDSLLFPLLLHYNYWKETGTTTHLNQELVEVMKAAMTVMKVEQNHFHQSEYNYKPFGHKMKDGIGLVWSFALPSDDQAGGYYNIPRTLWPLQCSRKLRKWQQVP
jgi:meiotically up-regulated gene 157 (Mug157) protein